MSRTAKEIMEMHPNLVRRAIALELGWRESGKFVIPPEGDKRNTHAAEWDKDGCPHWMEHWESNIADAYDLEGTLEDGSRGMYSDFLGRVIRKEHGLWVYHFELAHATPMQRCRAYLMTKESERNIYFVAAL